MAVRERSFGVIRADGTEKPAAGVVRDFARRLVRGEVALGPRPRILDVDADEYYADPDHHMRRLYAGWHRTHAPA